MIERCRRGCREVITSIARRSVLPATRIKVWTLYAVTIVCVIVGASFILHTISNSDHLGSSRFKGIVLACEDQNRRNHQAIQKTRHQAARLIGITAVGSATVKASLQRAITIEREQLIDVELPVRNCVARARRLTR